MKSHREKIKVVTDIHGNIVPIKAVRIEGGTKEQLFTYRSNCAKVIVPERSKARAIADAKRNARGLHQHLRELKQLALEMQREREEKIANLFKPIGVQSC